MSENCGTGIGEYSLINFIKKLLFKEANVRGCKCWKMPMSMDVNVGCKYRRLQMSEDAIV